MYVIFAVAWLLAQNHDMLDAKRRKKEGMGDLQKKNKIRRGLKQQGKAIINQSVRGGGRKKGKVE